MKAMKLRNPAFNPVHIQLEISTQKELDLINGTVDAMAPLDSTAACLNQEQYEFAFKVLCLLRNAVRMDFNRETEMK
jgi:hypothetical protein